jgi:DNA-binding NtrC family response regulator
VRRLLVVDPSARRLELLRQRLSDVDEVIACSDFARARERLLADLPQFVIANIRLGPFNGLHLVYLAAAAHVATRSIMYDEQADPGLVAEAKSLGAFFETAERLPFALPAYLAAELPDRDRRMSRDPERRRIFRGGRRASDVAPEFLGYQAAVLH